MKTLLFGFVLFSSLASFTAEYRSPPEAVPRAYPQEYRPVRPPTATPIKPQSYWDWLESNWRPIIVIGEIGGGILVIALVFKKLFG